MIALIWASFYAGLDVEVKGFEGWVILGISIALLILLRKQIKQLVIGVGSGYMIGIGVAAIGFQSIFDMGWSYIIDSIYFPGLAIILFVAAGISYQYYLGLLESGKSPLTKKQTNLYFGGGALLLLILFITIPKVITPQKSELEMAFEGLQKELNDPELKKSYEELKSTIESAKDDASTKELKEATKKLSEAGNASNQQELENALEELEALSRELKSLPEKQPDEQIQKTTKSAEETTTNEIKKTTTKYAVVSTNKAHFFDENKQEKSAYLISGQAISYNKKDGNFIYASYTNKNGKTTNGWMKISDFELTDYDLSIDYKINDPDGYSNLRATPGGEVIKKVYEDERFKVFDEKEKHKKVALADGTVGYIHNSRVVKVD
jgi:hypothetical protein